MTKNRNEDKEKDRMDVEEADRQGDEKMSETHDFDFYSEIGRKSEHRSDSSEDEDEDEETKV
ncbi:MAG TPA: glucose starvation-inducible protein B [Candidatus Paceibacterota bacterium]|jgi:general stress protein YciG|nr:glucose starvation-inducible protein B [Candidatus Paceibacterota bacterium]HPB60612.1 glucose starvation-inducible protein B [Candidatus Paceibacterota bacterium]HPI24621.1 glucose starvation-inducible protein B [Candidatus Paceibacterota bacterium]HPN89684.1 glucose starvation-inducible protein B [Candidatus Paceibacterota bacterium]HPV33474.1 glucose starvation-inducible protein B [Candidatus Paceibacterota bacterium]